ncbi:hypothetical protein PSE_2112 [Pseudovibrio sp. FO-BEG1]|nr:hypothetical protein PSE_2112 [Pseudovibrio sp. FO-BEG1]
MMKPADHELLSHEHKLLTTNCSPDATEQFLHANSTGSGGSI